MLTPDGEKREHNGITKYSRGVLAGNVMHIGDPQCGKPICIVEGPEDALSDGDQFGPLGAHRHQASGQRRRLRQAPRLDPFEHSVGRHRAEFGDLACGQE